MEDYEIEIFHYYILDWYDKNKREFPWRYTFDPYKVLVSEILLQQTNVRTVTSPYLMIISKYKNITSLSNADIIELKEIVKGIGLVYRADRLINISKEIIQNHSGEIPDEWNNLIRIKGIGKYICSAILCFGYNKPYAILDTNVIRLFERIFGLKSECSRPREDKKLWSFAQMLLPGKDYVHYNYALLDFASMVCTAANPKCDLCPLKQLCRYPYDNK